MMPDNSPDPLDYHLSSIRPDPPRVRDKLIGDTWRTIEQRLASRGSSISTVDNMRQAFASGLYAASAAITLERADAQTISEAAFRIEKLRWSP